MLEIDLNMLLAVLCLIVFDMISGIVKAVYLKTFSSTKMREGLFHKAGTVMILFLAAGLTAACQMIPGFPQEFAIVYVPTCALIALMEISSILENIGEINPDLKQYKIFDIFKRKED